MNFLFKQLIGFTLLFGILFCNAKNLKASNGETEPIIKSVFLYKKGWQLSYPILNLNKQDEKLVLSFDDLSAEYRDFQYRIVHCDANWNPSNLTFYDYGLGLPEAYINQIEMSRNTLKRYVHYELTLPNDDVGFKISGNYRLDVFEDHNPQKIVFSKKFFVFESRVIFDVEIQRSTNVEIRNTHQEVDFSIKETNYHLTNPYQDLKVLVMQNFRTDNMVSLAPQFVKGTELEYNYDLENTFEGCNEFRYIDIRNTGGMINASFGEPINGARHLKIFKDDKRSFINYKNIQDINGRRLIMVNDLVFNDNLDADYFYTTFTLDYPYLLPDGDLYVFGELSNWQFQEEFKMNFIADKLIYQATPLLKQGYYNYLYLFKPNDKTVGECHWVEGSHHQTENEYYIFVYHKAPNNNYDALIGMYSGKFPNFND